MKRSTCHSRLNDQQRLSFKINYNLVFFLFYLSFVSSTHFNQEDNDLIFDEENQSLKNERELYLSTQDNNYKTSRSVSNNENLKDSNDDSDDPFFKKLNHYLLAVKRKLFDFSWANIFSDAVNSTVTDETISKSRPKRNIKTSENSANDGRELKTEKNENFSNNSLIMDEGKRGDTEDNNSDDEYDEEIDDDADMNLNGSGLIGDPSSGDFSVSVVPISTSRPSQKNYFRLIIKLLEPYDNETFIKSGSKFKLLATNITGAINQILSAPDFIKSEVVGYMSASDISSSKAIVDLETSGNEGHEKIQSLLFGHLAMENTLNSLKVSPEVEIYEFGETLPIKCEDDQLPCMNSPFCYDFIDRCNGLVRCPDLSDELNCPGKNDTDLPKLEKLCRGDSLYFCPKGGRIICSQEKCDGIKQCIFGEDEEDCLDTKPRECTQEQFYCDNTCFPKSIRCDGNADCSDKFDELNCTKSNPNFESQNRKCSDEEFKCDDKCWPNSKQCDNVKDCLDGSDENNCTTNKPPCQFDQFSCYDGFCLNSSQRCDGIPNCSQREDEIDCINSTTTSTCIDGFLCRDGTCISKKNECDNYPHCPDYSDEENCNICKTEEFQCRSNRQCIPIARRCNAYFDCLDHSDEENCPFSTARPPPPTTEVFTTKYISTFVYCRTDQFKCQSNGLCVPLYYRCNGKFECNDGSDEFDCADTSQNKLDLRAYPTDQVVKEREDVVFLCRDESNLRARVLWTRGNNLSLPPGSQNIITEGRLEIPKIQLHHAGPYICKATGDAARLPGSEITVYLRVESWPEIPTSVKSCGISEATCHNGDCISKQFVCNGRPDCADGSDEFRCNFIGCEPNEFRCHNQRCIQTNWRCDSEDDCGDLSDEQNCVSNVPGSLCRYDEFRCFNNSQCVPKAFHCDYEIDCVDGSDEIGCSNVMIIRNPPENVELHVGNVFNISCQMVGIPSPEIIWRLNWGHIPAKCSTISINGIGVLTCPNIDVEDSGAYSCEGINNRGRVFATDTILIVTPNKCLAESFNDLAKNSDECITCFCFGITKECKSANLFTYQLPPSFFPVRILSVYFNPRRIELDIKTNDQNPLQSSIEVLDSNSFRIRGVINESFYLQQSLYPYFALPDSYLGNQLKSYGGYIRYRIRFNGDGIPITLPSIIISGNGYKLMHIGLPYVTEQEKEESVRLFTGFWYKLSTENFSRFNNSSSIPSILASREEIIMTLAKLDQILLKIQFVESKYIDTNIINFQMDSASSVNTGRGQAAYVEECRCPDGYFGLSCETCAPGYQRYSVGPWLGNCRKINSCPPGTYLDPFGECHRCPCPLTISSNQFAQSCFASSDGEIICNCPVGYEGKHCEYCSPGFIGNPLIPGESCQKPLCDPSGSLSLTVDPNTGYCNCKENFAGAYCNQCKANTFYLQSNNTFGCIKCFCMGVTENCFSSNWYRQQIVAMFVRDSQEFKIGLRENVELDPNQNIIVNPDQREIVFSSFEFSEQGVYYWSLPQQFLGNKVTSYGGILNYTIRYIPTPGGQFSRNNAPDVEIISENNGIHLFYFKHDELLEPNVFQTVSVPLFEQQWQRTDGQIVNREHLLMALADLKSILIKATYTTKTQEVALRNVILEVAEDQNTGQRRAYEVEECKCPTGYRGTSCEECDVGFHRVDDGFYLGLCESCNCHGHSKDCDAETGICLNCANHTTGNNCDKCEPDYIGNPIIGEACILPPDRPCKCDSRGRLNLDCRDQRCTCKINVVGVSCDLCKEGTFDLQEYHETGCLECYCSGTTNKCQSSNLFVTQIPMSVLDNSHGFSLTESDRSRVIKTGFKLNIAQNQIGYDYTTERGQRLFWSLPSKFTGNKITSYGGNLTWTQGYIAPFNAFLTYYYDVIIVGDGISLFWTNNIPIVPNTNVTTSIKLEENGFVRVTEAGRQKATRSDILRVLSSVEAILIRASYASQTSYVFISDVSLDTAISQSLSSMRATQIEVCRCPPGYKGYSCESCISGYYQIVSHNGYGKECHPCPCNGHEENCMLDSNSRIICKCKPGYTGEFCEEHDTLSIPPSISSPTIVINMTEPLIKIVAVGDTIRYTCNAVSLAKKNVSIVWSREGASLPEGRAFDYGSGVFVIINAVVSDSGTYKCTAFDSISYVSQNVTIKVQDTSAPKVIITPETSDGVLEFNTGDIITINCEAIGSPTATVEWSRDDGVQIYKRIGVRNLVFRIASAKTEDEGTYYCRGGNNMGSDIQKITIRIKNNQPPPVNVFIIPTEFKGKPGETVRLDCIVTSTDLRPVWSRKDYNLPQSAEERNGILIIYDAKFLDSGVYICSAISIHTNEVLSLSEVKVDIVDGNSLIVTKPPIVNIDPEKQLVAQGSLAIIKCTSPSDPNKPITWHKVGENITSGVQILGSELRIPSAQIKDRGVYVCQIENELGISRATSKIEVDRREPPTIEIYPSVKQFVEEGGSIFIQCKIVKGIPLPKIKWLRRKQQSFTSHVEEINGALRFINVNEDDAGEYLCTAENAVGSVEAIAILEIISRPIITITPSGPIYVKVGDFVKLECFARGKPAPTVTWDNRGLSAESRGIETGTAILQITKAQLSDAGVYTCSAVNSAGRSEEVVQLLVKNGLKVEKSTMFPEEEIIIPLGSNADLRCDATPVKEPIFISWKKNDENSILNYPTSERGILNIYNVQRSDAGKYICLGISRNTGITLFMKTVNLKVIVPPQITLDPIRQVVRPGDNAQITCSATGDEEITIYWSTVNGNSLPKSVFLDKGLLQFRGITVFDAGRYVCRARNSAGEAEAVAEVIINDIVKPTLPVIIAEDHHKTALENSDMDLKCTVDSVTTDYQVTWSRDRSNLPQNSQILGNILRLFKLKVEDSDRYICKVTSPYGHNLDYIDLEVARTCLSNEFQCKDGMCIPNLQFCDTIQHCADNSDEIDCHKHRRGINNVTLIVEANQGDTLYLTCKMNRDPSAKGIWSKVDGIFQPNVQTQDDVLRISDVQISNAGIYRCSDVRRDNSEYVDYQLNIQLAPGATTTAAVTKKSAKYGQIINLDCETDLDPPVEYSWVIHSIEKSLRKIIPNTKTLKISDLNANNSGIYFCNAVSNRAIFNLPIVLTVDNIIPAFSGSSYLALHPLINALDECEIEITFKPKSYDGVILYNGQKSENKGDYILFGLRQGIPEFRFDVGSGPAIIKGELLLKLNKWHTVRLFRHGKNGTMEVNGLYNFTGSSPGKFETLDLQLPLYIGGIPNYQYISDWTNFNVGFNGCINKLVINSNNIELKREAVDVVNLENCNNCEYNPCVNNGFCQETSSSTGYTCICLPGFSGENCDLKKDTCYLDSCGKGECLENENGIECLCPFGKTGKHCRKNIEIRTPAFTKNSYLAYPTPLLKKKLKIFMKLKPMSESYVENGILLYIAESDGGTDDFISLLIIDSFIELKFRIMSKYVTLRSNHYLIPGEYVTLSFNIDSSEVQFNVANETTIVEKFNPNDGMNDLRLHTSLYIGGYDKKAIKLPEEIFIKTGFYGCISAIESLGADIRVLQSLEAININDCFNLFGDICETVLPCQNGGTCFTSQNKYKCECTSSYSGQNCEKRKDMCEILNPCKNNGKCQGTTGSYKCYCGLGFMGSQCEKETILERSVSFDGDGYIELNIPLLPHDDFFIAIIFTTSASNGLLLWQGRTDSSVINENDFIAVAVHNGYVKLSYSNDSTSVKVLSASNHKVNDNYTHSVIIRKTNTELTLELDSTTTEFGTVSNHLNIAGNIYIGGLPDVRFMTGNQYSENFVGCVHQLKINNRSPIDFNRESISARNAAPCSIPGSIFDNQV